jgi:hypothetical protein
MLNNDAMEKNKYVLKLFCRKNVNTYIFFEPYEIIKKNYLLHSAVSINPLNIIIHIIFLNIKFNYTFQNKF